MGELKPCPFCGGEGLLLCIPPEEHYTVECEDCDLWGPVHALSEDAEKAWNHRPLESVNADLLEGLKQAHAWLEYENSPMGPNEEAAYHRMMERIEGAVSRANQENTK